MTVVGAAVILGLVALSLVMALGVAEIVHTRRAVSAADLTALSAATVLQTAGATDACSAAADIADANGADLVDCTQVSGEQTTYGPSGVAGIRVTVAVSGKEASAAAGPVE